jgi:hypothetical protein
VKDIIDGEYVPCFIILIIVVFHLLEHLLLQVEEWIPAVATIALLVVSRWLRVLWLEDLLLVRSLSVIGASLWFDHELIHLRLKIIVI